METRRHFMNSLLVSLSALVAALFAAACGKKPDAVTEPSPEWPPKD